MTTADPSTSASAAAAGQRRRRPDLAVLGLAAILIFTTALRLLIAPHRPLWLDEVWTGMIVSQPSLTEFARQCSYDINAPLYYVITGLWAQVAGVSNFALRFPALAFGALTPFLALTPTRLLGRTSRFVWCILLACWIPGLVYSLEARYYTLLFFMAAANTIAFASLMRAPTARAAWIWTGLSALMILSHYFGFILAGLQGLVYLAVWRIRAVKTWPAALAFLPPFASLTIHMARLELFVRPGLSWIPLLHASSILPAVGFMVGAVAIWAFIGLWGVAGVYFDIKAMRAGTAQADPAPQGRHLWIAVGCAAVAAALAIAAGFIKPMFVTRYLIAFTPGVLLGLALLAERFERTWARASVFLVAVYVAVAIKLAAAPPYDMMALTFETASDALMTHAPKRLAFMWDNPTEPEASALRGVGGFFFTRAGRPVEVDPVRARAGQDSNLALLRQAQRPDTAILWIYDLTVNGTSAIRFPPRIAAIDPRWQCRNYGESFLGVMACYRTR